MKRRPRVMWLLSHGAARRFEVAMLKRIGFNEIFLPKKYPDDPSFRSASIDYSEDVNLTIPPADLAVLNATDWYAEPGSDAWEIANRYFDVLFFVMHGYVVFDKIVRHFRGVVLWRAYGMQRPSTYDGVLQSLSDNRGADRIRSLGNRLFFAQAYSHLNACEPDYLSGRRLYLPLGLVDVQVSDQWRGGFKRILFVCPDIGFNHYYKEIYDDFVKLFADFPYAIGGVQPVRVDDPNVLGFLPREAYDENMREMRVMFYHSTEPNHIHYHPFEAIRAGMPLVFMAGGILDRFGGANLPGCCKTIKEARHKIERILNDDWALIERIRRSQSVLLEPMRFENCEADWRAGFGQVLAALEKSRAGSPTEVSFKPKRVAVILPVAYRGGSLHGAKLLAQAIDAGARQAGESVEVVFAHLDNTDFYTREEFEDLPDSIKRRPYVWRTLGLADACGAMAYAGLERPLDQAGYQVPDDGINQFMDCDLWLIVSDRLAQPLLPVRPYVLMVYDYLQRYVNLLPDELNRKFLSAAHGAERVLVTTEFTRRDAIQFAGLPSRKVVKLPMLAPAFTSGTLMGKGRGGPRYFLWTTNLAPHKNHVNAFKALRKYYEEHDGRLECRVTGVGTKDLLSSDLPHLRELGGALEASPLLKQKLKLLGELPDRAYRTQLEGAEFLWHAGRIDNGTFSVVEAAQLGVPSLSSDYPAMREIEAQFHIEMAWMDPDEPAAMARQLERMERESRNLRSRLPSSDSFTSQSVEKLAGAYWAALQDCL